MIFVVDQSDDDSSTSAAEEERTLTVTEHDDEHQRTTSGKPLLSALRDTSTCIPPFLKPDFSDLVGNAENMPNEDPIGKQTQKSRGLSVNPCKEGTSDSHKRLYEETGQSQRRSSGPSRGSPIKGGKIATAILLTKTESYIIPENVNSPNFSEKGNKMEIDKFLRRPVIPDSVNSSTCLSSRASPDDAAAKCSKETSIPSGNKKQRTQRPSRVSPPSLLQSVILSGATQSVASNSAVDDVFEDYFSPAQNHQKTIRHLLPDLPVEKSIHIPFDLDSVLKKRKRRTCESNGFATKNNKKKKLEENDSGKNPQTDAEIEDQSPSRCNVEGSLLCGISNVTHAAKKGRQSTLPFIRTSTTDATTQRRASTSSMSKFMERNMSSSLQTNNLSYTSESK